MCRYEESEDYRRVKQAIRFIAEHRLEQPGLDEVADHLGLSPYHVQRLFTRWAGVSPKRFLQYVTLEHAKELLRGSDTVLDASYGAGLSGAGRPHDLCVTLEGVTPGEIRNGGQGVEISWGIHSSPFGPAFLAATDRGLTTLSFVPSEGPEPLLEELEDGWPEAEIVRAPGRTAPVARQIFGTPGGRSTSQGESPSPLLRPSADGGPPALRLQVQGTNFQVRVWEALLRVPAGRAVSYSDLAAAVGSPEAARAVGGAVSRNPVAVIIPCHRVLRRDGSFGGYAYGETCKRALLAWEEARLQASDSRARAGA